MAQTHQYLRYGDLAPAGIPFSRTHLRRMIAAGLFPAPVNLGPQTIAWLRDDVEAYKARVAARDPSLARKPRAVPMPDAGGADAA